MPYRKLPERDRAREQFDRLIDKRVRHLERRSRYPGAVRIVEQEQTITVPTNRTVTSMSLYVDRGAWIVHAACNVNFVSSGTHEAAVLDVLAFDPVTGGAVDLTVCPATFSSPFASTSAAVIPLRVFGFGRWDERTRLDLTVSLLSTPSTHNVEIADGCVMVIPT